MKKNLFGGIALFCLLSLSLPVLSQPLSLPRNHWADTAYKALTAVISQYGVRSNHYNKDVKPYAVFDFDNTTAINDVEETLILYQIENLCFKIKPQEMYDVLTGNVPDVHRTLAAINSSAEGKNITAKMLADDIVRDYSFLYRTYIGRSGKKSLKKTKESAYYYDFRCKLRYMYDAIGDTFDPTVADAWILYLFKNMSAGELQSLTQKSIDYWLTVPMKKVTWESPDRGAGKLSISVKMGFAISEEMKSLYRCLMANGFDVYICSASLREVVEVPATLPKYGLCLPKSHVLGVMLKKQNGRFMNALDTNEPLTLGEGKVTAIRSKLASLHQGHGPVLVGGDSNGDYNMLTEFPDMQCGLIINRLPSGNLHGLCVKALNEKNSKYVLQGRDDNKGVFLPSQSSVLLGETAHRLIRK